jgi:hypothetical protein
MSGWMLQTECDACGSRCAHYTDNESGEVSRLCGGTDLAEVAAAYIECALWSSTDNSDESGGNPLDDGRDESDVADEAWISAVRDCADFLDSESDDLDGDECELNNEQVGRDFWLTRNGHGAGFWDRGLGALGDRLSKACEPYGGCDLYLGDDGKVYGF